MVKKTDISCTVDGIALKSVHVEGHIHGTLATMSISQHYRNDCGKRLEVIYTFPLPHEAVLQGMAATMGKSRMNAVVMDRVEAWERYETDLEHGHMPILLEQPAPDLCTVNLGNIENSEEAVVTMRYCQLLPCDNDRMRLDIPTAIALRSGDQYQIGGLSPHENISTNILAVYPLTLRLTLHGIPDAAAVQCPSHLCSMRRAVDGLVVELLPGALLDRDCVFVVSGVEPHPGGLPTSNSSRHSDMYMVHKRKSDASVAIPELHQVPQMFAAGYGGFGALLRSSSIFA